MSDLNDLHRILVPFYVHRKFKSVFIRLRLIILMAFNEYLEELLYITIISLHALSKYCFNISFSCILI